MRPTARIFGGWEMGLRSVTSLSACRVAAGAGLEVPEVNKLLKQHKQMVGMMKKVKKMGKKASRLYNDARKEYLEQGDVEALERARALVGVCALLTTS